MPPAIWRATGVEPEAADDLAQEALLKLIAVGSEVEKPLAWLKVIVERLAPGGKSAVHRKATGLPPGTEIRFDPWQCRDDWLDLGEASKRLPRRMQVALLLVAEGHTEREIALALHCSVKAVKRSCTAADAACATAAPRRTLASYRLGRLALSATPLEVEKEPCEGKLTDRQLLDGCPRRCWKRPQRGASAFDSPFSFFSPPPPRQASKNVKKRICVRVT